MTRPATTAAIAAPSAPAPVDCTVLALDPSTTWTGYAIIRFTAAGCMTLVDGAAFDAEECLSEYNHANKENGMRAAGTNEGRFVRIRKTAFWLGCIVFKNYPIDAIAYENPNMRGAGATAAIHQAIGAYVASLPYTVGLPIISVNASTAKSLTLGKGSTFRAKGQTAGSLDEKGRMVQWARQNVSGFAEAVCGRGREATEAIADACSIAWAAWKKGLK